MQAVLGAGSVQLTNANWEVCQSEEGRTELTEQNIVPSSKPAAGQD